MTGRIAAMLLAAFGLAFLAAPDLRASDDGSGMARHEQLYAVPVSEGGIPVDGRRIGWDLSGQIEMFVMADTKDTQSRLQLAEWAEVAVE